MSRELDEALVEKIKKMEVRIARLEDMVKDIYIISNVLSNSSIYKFRMGI